MIYRLRMILNKIPRRSTNYSQLRSARYYMQMEEKQAITCKYCNTIGISRISPISIYEHRGLSNKIRFLKEILNCFKFLFVSFPFCYMKSSESSVNYCKLHVIFIIFIFYIYIYIICKF